MNPITKEGEALLRDELKKLKSEDENKQFTVSRENLINEIKKLQ